MKPIQIERAGGIAHIECRWTRGCIDAAAAQDLSEIAEDLRLDDDIGVVVLRSRGEDFCLGGEALAWGAGPDCIGALGRLPQPVIAVVQGRAWAEGCELALACDLRLASDRATFRLPQVVLGRLPVHGGTQRLPRLIGMTRALEILWSGRIVEAAEAAQIGLANRVVPQRQLTRAATSMARDLGDKGPQALRLAKEAVHAAGDLTLGQGIRLEQDLYVLLQTSEDRAEGVRAFLQKRRPKFRGR